MPGVSVITDTWAGPASTPSPAHAAYFIAGLADRGPVGIVGKVQSLAEFEALYGPRVAYGALHDDLRVYFAEGGGEAYISRVVGGAATKGTVSLDDRGDPAEPTLKFDAVGPGAWSGDLDVVVAAGTAAGSYKITLVHSGATVGTYDNLVTPADAVAALASSKWVTATDLGSESIAPANPPEIGPARLSAGTDDRATVDAADVATALTAFGPDLGSGAVAAPGFPAATVGDTLIAHAKTHRRIALLAGASDDTPAEAIDAAADIIGEDNDGAGYFYPWVTIPDGSSSKNVSPEGFVAAVRARSIRLTGAWAVPAGEAGMARFILAPVTALTRVEGDDLDENQVSAIRTIAGSPRLYGWRTLSSDRANFPTLNARDLLNFLDVDLSAAVEQYVFSPIDPGGQLLSRIRSTLIGRLDPVRAAGGLFERLDPVTRERIDPGYVVDVGPAVNTDETLTNNEVRALVTVRIAPIGQEITITIVKASLTAGL